MRTPAVLCSAAAMLGVVAGAAAVAQVPVRPAGNFGGGALVAPPKDLFGPGNAVIGLRALPRRQLEIEATVRARCAGGDITAAAKVAADGSFSADGSETQEPTPGETVKTQYTLAGSFTSATAANGTLSATLERSTGGPTMTCKTGEIAFEARRPDGVIGKRGAKGSARYFGTTAQRGVGPRRPIVLRISGDGRRISYALFGEHVRCSDGKRSIGVEAPRTNIRIDGRGRVTDRDRDTIDNGTTVTKVDDHFSALIGRDGAKGTFSLNDRTLDKLTGNIIQTCTSGTVRWLAAP